MREATTAVRLFLLVLCFLCTAAREGLPDICVTNAELANGTFFVIGDAAALLEWWSSSNGAETNASFFLATVAMLGAIGWTDAGRTVTLPPLPSGAVLFDRPLSEAEISEIPDFTTRRMAHYFGKLRDGEDSRTVTAEEGVWTNDTAAEIDGQVVNTSDEDEDLYDVTASYNGKPLSGTIAFTVFEINLVSRDGYKWPKKDVENAEKAIFGSTLALSYLGAEHFCRGVTWLLELVPHDDPRARVDGVVTASLYDRGMWISQIAPKMGANANEDLHATIALSWIDATGVSASYVVTGYLLSERSSGSCGLCSSSKYVMAVTRTYADDKGGCMHWSPDTLFMHELLHVFGACDEYGACSCRCSRRWCEASIPWGCYTNWNCPNCMPTTRCVMRGGEHKPCICPATALQVGWGLDRRNELDAHQCGSVPAPSLLQSAALQIAPVMSLLLAEIGFFQIAGN